MKLTSRFLAFCFLISSGVVYAQKKETQKPNIVFILADDLGYGDVGSYGQKQILTPNIDELVKEGVKFTDFYAGAPVCSPSRGSLLTGLNTGHATIRGNNTIQGGLAGKKGAGTVYRTNLSTSDYTIGNILQDAGYTTSLVGKWHVDGYDSLATPLQRGFDHFTGWLINLPETYARTYWPEKRYRDGKLITIEENQNGKKGYYEANMCTDEALSFLEGQKDAKKPFFLMLNYNNPHSPLDVPDQAIYTGKDWPEDMKTYAAMVYYLDRSVAKIKDYLIKSGLSENTIVFFASDNGPRSEPTAPLTKVAQFFDSNASLRGYKRDLSEGGIRIPFVVWSPLLKNVPRTSAFPGYFADIMPTFGEIAGIKPPVKTDGESIYTAIKGAGNKADAGSAAGSKTIGGKSAQKARPGHTGKESAKFNVTKDRFLYWEFFEKGFEQAVRYGKWKAIKRQGKLELYNLDDDIGEKNDISAAHPDIVKKIEDYLLTARTASPYWPVKS